jgi:hypothetical protein
MSLGFLILTQFYSLLQIFAALATLVIGVNWVYVNAYVQGQRFIASKPANEVVNPHKYVYVVNAFKILHTYTNQIIFAWAEHAYKLHQRLLYLVIG